MSDRKKHQHADIIKLWADGYSIQYYDRVAIAWVDVENPLWELDTLYRVKPSKIEISKGVEIPEPLRVTPQIGSLCYTPSLDSYDSRSFGIKTLYYDGHNDVHCKLFEDGLLHREADDALIHCEAIRGLTRKKEK